MPYIIHNILCTFFTQTQTGITHQNNYNDEISFNIITGFGLIKKEVYGMNVADNLAQRINCNSTTNTFEGIRFGGSSNLTTWQTNTMKTHKRGMHLNNTVIGQQGAVNYPMDNAWSVPSFWSPFNLQTYVTSTISATFSSASPIYVKNGALFKPIFNSGAPLVASYTFPTSLFTTMGSGYVCGMPNIVIAGDGCVDCVSGSPLARSLGQIVSDSIMYLDYQPTMRLNSKHSAHKFIKQHPNLLVGNSTLQNFNNSYNTGNVNTLETVEDALGVGNLTTASSINNGITTTNVIETNTKLFYKLYIKAKDGTYDTTDASQLLVLAKGCPERDGLVVYQARVLYNSINEEFNLFQNNCTTASSARMGDTDEIVNNPIIPYNTINVYPNPSTNTFNINLAEAGIEQASLKIYDVNGRIVLEKEVNTTEKPIVELKLNNAEGIYLLILTDVNTNVFYKQKLVIQK